jgi:hypothetical protein
MKRLALLNLVLIAAATASEAAIATGPYSISGRLTTASGAAVPGVRFCLFAGSACQRTSAATDAAGYYRIDALPGNARYWVMAVDDDRNRTFVYMPFAGAASRLNVTVQGATDLSIPPRLVRRVEIGLLSVGGVDFRQLPVPEAESGFSVPLPSFVASAYGYTYGQQAYYSTVGWVYHPGQDLNSASNALYTNEVHAVADGIVVDVRPAGCLYNCWGGVVIKHTVNGSPFYSSYGHLDVDTTLQIGSTVEKGDLLGWEADRGSAGQVHLHFEIRTGTHPYPYYAGYYSGGASGLGSQSNVLLWYEHPEAFIDSHPASGGVIVVDERETLAAGDAWQARHFAGTGSFVHFQNANLVPGRGYGGHYQYATTTAGTATAWGEWRFYVGEAGPYQIDAFIPGANATTLAARYRLDGQVITPALNQYLVAWDWTPVSPSARVLSAGWHVVRLDNQTGEAGRRVAWDALRIRRVDAPEPSLLVEGRLSASLPQGSTFRFDGRDFTPNAVVRRYLRQGTGAAVELTPQLAADSAGRIYWSYSTSCTTPAASYTVWALDGATRLVSNSVTEAITAGACSVPALVSPAPGSRLAATAVTFVWTSGNGVLRHWLYAGTTPGGAEIANSNALGAATLRYAVSRILTGGRSVYVRLWWESADGWHYADYRYIGP